MLKNAYLLAKIGADTAENERNFAEILPKIGNYPPGAPAGKGRVIANFVFCKMSLVFGCIGTDLCK